MSAYLVVHITIKNREKFQEYGAGAAKTLPAFGGELLLRGKVSDVLSGDHSHPHAVIIKFPDSGSIKRWYRSAEYQALIPNRDKAADMVFLALEEPPA